MPVPDCIAIALKKEKDSINKPETLSRSQTYTAHRMKIYNGFS